MKEVQGKSILVRVIGSRLSLEDFARILKKKKDTVESFMLLLSPERYYGSDRKMIKLLAFDNLFLPLRHSR